MAYVPVPSSEGLRRVPVEDLTADELSLLGSYLNAVGKVLSNQDPYAAEEFLGISIGGIPLPTDPDELEDLAFRNELDIDDFYTMPETE
jgi:hypothetical protein